MTVIRISEATNRQLDWLVAKAEGHDVAVSKCGDVIIQRDNVVDYFNPTVNWGWGGPIMERKGIEPAKLIGRQVGYTAFMNNDIDSPEQLVFMYGNTYLQASMRCIAVHHFGETAEIPEELI